MSPAIYHGLVNKGATCYLNSVLQVLFMTKDFREAVQRLANKNNVEFIDGHLKELFDELLEQTAETSGIIKALDIDRVYEQRDAAEYLERILRLTSPEAAKIFHGELVHRTNCQTCLKTTDVGEPFWYLPLSLVDSSSEDYSVEGAIREFFRTTEFSGQNQMYCDSCDGKVDATSQYVMKHHPDVLILLLKRFDFSYFHMSYIKINCVVDVPYSVNIPQNQVYELYAVVDHFGDLRSGHYTTCAKSQDEEDQWYIFNDTNVSSFHGCLFHWNGMKKSRTAYLLIYRRKDTGPQNINEISSKGGSSGAASEKCDRSQDAEMIRDRQEDADSTTIQMSVSSDYPPELQNNMEVGPCGPQTCEGESSDTNAPAHVDKDTGEMTVDTNIKTETSLLESDGGDNKLEEAADSSETEVSVDPDSEEHHDELHNMQIGHQSSQMCEGEGSDLGCSQYTQINELKGGVEGGKDIGNDEQDENNSLLPTVSPQIGKVENTVLKETHLAPRFQFELTHGVSSTYNPEVGEIAAVQGYFSKQEEISNGQSREMDENKHREKEEKLPSDYCSMPAEHRDYLRYVGLNVQEHQCGKQTDGKDDGLKPAHAHKEVDEIRMDTDMKDESRKLGQNRRGEKRTSARKACITKPHSCEDVNQKELDESCLNRPENQVCVRQQGYKDVADKSAKKQKNEDAECYLMQPESDQGGKLIQEAGSHEHMILKGSQVISESQLERLGDGAYSSKKPLVVKIIEEVWVVSDMDKGSSKAVKRGNLE